MAGCYVDTSALGRVLLGEPDAPAVLASLGRYETRISGRLLALELRRLGLRVGMLADAERLLGAVAIVPLREEVLRAADVVPPASVASLDAIHLAGALDLARAGVVDAIMTYDARLAEGAAHHGLAVVTPA